MSENSMKDRLSNVKLFRVLKDGELSDLAEIVTAVSFGKGETVFSEKEPGDAMYQIIDGAVTISKKDITGGERVIAELKENDIFGEMALLTDLPRSASAVCAEHCHLLKLDKARFDELLKSNSISAYKVTYHLGKILSERLKNVTEEMAKALRHQEMLEKEGSRKLKFDQKIFNEWSF